jgi:hypothetical protein
MSNLKRTSAAVVATIGLGVALTACSSDADVASNNLSKAADNFEIQRRIVFYNGITGDYILEVIGRCSLGNDDPAGQLSVTCMTGPNEYKKHFLGLSDNVTYFAEQIKDADVSKDNYRVIFKPSVIVPDIDAR